MLRLMLFLSLFSCAHRAEVTTTTQDPEKLERNLASLVGSYSTSLEFEEGKTDLSAMSKQHLNELAARAQQDGREIDTIKILAWADQEYPDQVEKKAHPSQVILAKERAEAIKEYLQSDLRAQADVDYYNMAKRPGMFSKVVKGDEYEIKAAIEEMGPVPTTLDNGSVSYSKASRAVVIVDYNEE